MKNKCFVIVLCTPNCFKLFLTNQLVCFRWLTAVDNLCYRATMTRFLRGRSDRRWLWCWSTRSTIDDTCRTRSAQIQQAPASRSRQRRWTSLADVRCLLNRKCLRTSATDCTCRMTPSLLKLLSTRVIYWIREDGAYRFRQLTIDTSQFTESYDLVCARRNTVSGQAVYICLWIFIWSSLNFVAIICLECMVMHPVRALGLLNFLAECHRRRLNQA